MKPLLILLTVVASFFTKSSVANEGPVTATVLKSFNTSFAAAKQVAWQVIDNNFYKVDFTLNGAYITAFYNAQGNLAGITRNVASTQLPLALQASFKKHYTGFWIADLFEVANENGTVYYMTVENAKLKIILQSFSSSSWTVYQKIKKD